MNVGNPDLLLETFVVIFMVVFLTTNSEILITFSLIFGFLIFCYVKCAILILYLQFEHYQISSDKARNHKQAFNLEMLQYCTGSSYALCDSMCGDEICMLESMSIHTIM